MSEPAKKTKSGRPLKVLTDDQAKVIVDMVAAGATIDAIAAKVGIAPSTLRKRAGRLLIPPTPLLDAAPLQPAPPRRRRKPCATKPMRQASPDERRRVALWLSAASERLPTDVMAARLGMSAPTFRREFATELAQAASIARINLIERLNRASENGNVSATLKLLEMVDRREIEDLSKAASHPEPRPAPAGKKAAAQDAALGVADDPTWGADLQPGIQRRVQ